MCKTVDTTDPDCKVLEGFLDVDQLPFRKETHVTFGFYEIYISLWECCNSLLLQRADTSLVVNPSQTQQGTLIL